MSDAEQTRSLKGPLLGWEMGARLVNRGGVVSMDKVVSVSLTGGVESAG